MTATFHGCCCEEAPPPTINTCPTGPVDPDCNCGDPCTITGGSVLGDITFERDIGGNPTQSWRIIGLQFPFVPIQCESVVTTPSTPATWEYTSTAGNDSGPVRIISLEVACCPGTGFNRCRDLYYCWRANDSTNCYQPNGFLPNSACFFVNLRIQVGCQNAPPWFCPPENQDLVFPCMWAVPRFQGQCCHASGIYVDRFFDMQTAQGAGNTITPLVFPELDVN